jgi:hypothetical protein
VVKRAILAVLLATLGISASADENWKWNASRIRFYPKPPAGGGGGVGCTVNGIANAVVYETGAGGCASEAAFTYNPSSNILDVDNITLNNGGLRIFDTNASHQLSIVPGSDLTAARTFTLVTGDAARTVTLNGNPTLNDWFDQNVKAAASPTFARVGMAAGALATPNIHFGGDWGFLSEGTDDMGFTLDGSTYYLRFQAALATLAAPFTVSGAASRTTLEGPLVLDSGFRYSSTVTAGEITADVNDYTGCTTSTSSFCRVSTDATRTITSLARPASDPEGTVLTMCNVGGFNVVLADSSGLGTAENRFLFDGADVTMTPNQCVTLVYDITSVRWRNAVRPGAAGGGGAGTWGSITGTLSAQTDLQTALDAKMPYPGANGFLARTAATTLASRTFTSSDGSIIWVAPDGVASNPDATVDSSVFQRYAHGTADPPGTCVRGQLYEETDTAELYWCRNNVWMLLYGDQNTVPAADGGTGQTTATDDNALVGDGTAWAKEPIPDCDAADSALNYNAGGAAGSRFSCVTIEGSGGAGGTAAPNYSQSFTSQTSVTVTHNLGTQNLHLSCFDGSNNNIQPSAWSIAGTAPYDITVTFGVAQTGRCVVNGTGSNKYAADVASATTWTITGATHGLNTADLVVVTKDSSGNRIEPSSVSINATTKDVTIVWGVAQAGRVMLQ